MLAALETTATGLTAQQDYMNSIANNLANVNTTGYKESNPAFQTLLYQTAIQPGASSSGATVYPSGLSMGTGVQIASQTSVLTQGNLTQTSNPLNVAIQGGGYFQVLMPSGQIGYTRDGTFQLNQNGQLVTANGYQVLPNVTLPAGVTSITIGNDGTISVTTANSQNATQIGQLQLANFINAQGLKPSSQNLFFATNASGAAITGAPETTGLGSVNQGYLEASNTNVVEAMVNMISAQRAYQLGTQVASAAGQELSQLAQMAANA
jgi:flagellar basal-body rod protein FlgG